MPIILTALLAFAGTNIDDILILTLLFSGAATPQHRRRIILGQYLAVLTLTFFSLFFGHRLSSAPEAFVGLFGFIPIFLGLSAIRRARKKDTDSEEEGERMEGRAPGLRCRLEKIIPAEVLYVYFLTIANGADNISVYIPLFTGLGAADILAVIGIFILMIALWCFLGIKIGEYPAVKAFLERYQDILIPAVFIGLGVYILISNGSVYLMG